MALMQLPPDIDYTHLYLTARGMSGNVYDVKTGDHFPLQGGVWLIWPERRHAPNTRSRYGTLSSGNCYCFKCSDADSGPVLFLADPRDVAELCVLGAMRLDN